MRRLLTHLERLQQYQGNTIEIRYTSHEQFKKQTADSQAVIPQRGSVPRLRTLFSVPA
nr:ribose ABC transport system [Raoultella sp. NCTC 9187]